MKQNHKSEKVLLALLLEKDQEAWRDWYTMVSPRLMSICVRYVKDRHVANDVLQNSFVKLFHSISTFEYRGEGSLRAWMTRIVINEALSELKRSKEAFNFVSEEELHQTAELDPEVEGLTQEDILQLILQLPKGYRTVFNLYVFEHKTHREIAQYLNISESTSASQLHRAKQMLAEKINLLQQKVITSYET